MRVAADVVEEVAFLHMCGVSAYEWAARLGMTNGALSRALYRAGRADLARPVERIRGRYRRAYGQDR
jgi:hypothetical protein